MGQTSQEVNRFDYFKQRRSVELFKQNKKKCGNLMWDFPNHTGIETVETKVMLK
jgi:hypothetical protein